MQQSTNGSTGNFKLNTTNQQTSRHTNQQEKQCKHIKCIRAQIVKLAITNWKQWIRKRAHKQASRYTSKQEKQCKHKLCHKVQNGLNSNCKLKNSKSAIQAVGTQAIKNQKQWSKHILYSRTQMFKPAIANWKTANQQACMQAHRKQAGTQV